MLKKFIAVLIIFMFIKVIHSQGFEGYYQYPTIHDDMIVFAAEGDLWKVSTLGGMATRLTTHPEEETYPSISPDGQTIAYTASYEGPSEVYTLPINGGLTKRWTYESDFSLVNGWTSNGQIIYDTRAYSTLPDRQVVLIDPKDSTKTLVPLSQASEASYSNDGKTVYFVRPSFHGNVTKRYKGGTARQIWKFTEGDEEAVKLTTDYTGESHHPMVYGDQIYFITDRDGTMNIWSMDNNGSGLQQHTFHEDFDVRLADMSGDLIVYNRAADLWLYNIGTKENNKLKIRIPSDLDQLREKWVENPTENLTSVNASPNGDRIVLTVRGKVFVVPSKQGRIIKFDDQSEVRYRDAHFSPDGKTIYVQSDATGEFEFVKLPSNGLGSSEQISSGGDVLRYEGIVSPDNQYIAYDDIHGHLFVLNISSGESAKISTNSEGIGSFTWSKDGQWLAFEQSALNTMRQIHLYNVKSKNSFPITSDRANSFNVQWSSDGKFIYFLSDRSFTSLVGSPWGTRQPEPYFDAGEKLYILPLKPEYRSPFRPMNELFEKDTTKVEKVSIDQENIMSRIEEVPIKPGNYSGMKVGKDAIYLLSRSTGVNASNDLMVLKISNEEIQLKTVIDDVNQFDLTNDHEKLMIRKGSNYFMIDAPKNKVSDLSDAKIDLSGVKYTINPREDWRQIFTDAWRMERDYFYDENMHGVDWEAMHDKYKPLVERVTTREELSELIGRMVGELSVLHTSVRGGDTREDEQNIRVASLGGRFTRDEQAGGYRLEHIYQSDPDYPDERSPLDDPFLDIQEGDLITAIDGHSVLNSVDINEFLRGKGGQQVLLEIKRGNSLKKTIVEPLSSNYNLRYNDWEYSRRQEVEQASEGQIGYVHLRAMGSNDLSQWYRDFYPVFNRPGLIVDVRHNRGGNIESFVLEKLMRKAWMYWAGRQGQPSWNMQYAFRGHIVVLVDELTASDGEAFAEGFKRLDLGTTIGTRTWGGEVWLSSVNRLTDNGIARAPMNGVYGAEGEWLIEGHGFEPDIVVVNMPHETFHGRDAQLEKAIEILMKKIQEDPRAVPDPPAFPDMSFKNNAKKK
ncbi:S41 family peptidase [Portibacter marinus]|uniref:S41 family peptidase n=1 Tax=Portibacter marinus TaxID=2898660 RepID=UPI001F1CE737|nr:S41 family peptidase [Portibacter marinus]